MGKGVELVLGLIHHVCREIRLSGGGELGLVDCRVGRWPPRNDMGV